MKKEEMGIIHIHVILHAVNQKSSLLGDKICSKVEKRVYPLVAILKRPKKHF